MTSEGERFLDVCEVGLICAVDVGALLGGKATSAKESECRAVLRGVEGVGVALESGQDVDVVSVN